MNSYKMVKFLNMDKALLAKNGKTFLASFSNVPFTGPEVLVFPCDAEGNITDSLDVDGGRGYQNLQEFLTEVVLNTNRQ